MQRPLSIAVLLAASVAAAAWLTLNIDAQSSEDSRTDSPVSKPQWPDNLAVASTPAASRWIASSEASPRGRAPPRTIQQEIGSEGYGPHILRAAESPDPAISWQALQWILACEINPFVLYVLQVRRDNGAAHAEINPQIEAEHLVARRCQTVTDEHFAMLPDFVKRSLDTRIPGVAVAAFRHFHQFNPQLKEEVGKRIREDAVAGHQDSLTATIYSGDEIGLSVDDRIANASAMARLMASIDQGSSNPQIARPALEFVVRYGAILEDQLSPEAIVAAKAKGEQLAVQILAQRNGP